MKRFLTFLLVAIAATAFSCSHANSGVNQKSAQITFAETSHDFGTIEQNSVAEYSFVFRNTGKEPLVVSNVQTSCGCTVPDWTRDPVKKNNQGVVKVHYNTRATGSFNKSVTVHCNAGNTPLVLTIKGTVVAKKEQEKK